MIFLSGKKLLSATKIQLSSVLKEDVSETQVPKPTTLLASPQHMF